MAAELGPAFLSAGSGLVGALIGVVSGQVSVRGTRESDRRKRCVDRVLTAITELEKAHATYAVAGAEERDTPAVALPLQGAMRAYTQAVEMLQLGLLRDAAVRYQLHLTEYYLMYGQPRDELDAGRYVPTLQQLNAEHAELSAKLRNYEQGRQSD